MTQAEQEIFAFDDFVLDPRERFLLRRGTAVPLTAKAFDLLAQQRAVSGVLHQRVLEQIRRLRR